MDEELRWANLTHNTSDTWKFGQVMNRPRCLDLQSDLENETTANSVNETDLSSFNYKGIGTQINFIRSLIRTVI